jgi:AraC-like DNA-binding protein
MYMHSNRSPTTVLTVPAAPALVFRAVLQGTASLAWRNRQVRLDEDSWLVLDGRETCSVRLDPDRRTRMLAVVVSPDDVQAALASLRDGPDGAADGPQAAGAQDPVLARSAGWPAELAFADNLRPRDGPAGRRLLAIAEGRAAARPDPDEHLQRIALVRDACAEERALRQKAARIDCVKPATREQLLPHPARRRFHRQPHDEPISLDEMARAASLSRFHFVRLFSLVHGETPHAFLRRKRTAVARRHLAVGGACSEAASRAGFGSRSALFRNLRKSAPAGVGTDPCFPSA